jgi:hypothetical protein
VKKADGDKYCAAAVAVLETLTRLISNAFSLAIYTTFSHPDPSLKPCGCCTCLIIKQSKHFPFSPNLYTTALTVLRVMIYVTFESEGHANWPFLLQVDVAGDGSTKNNIK